MNKVCVVHGVGFSPIAVENFVTELGKSIDADVELYAWDHPGEPPDPIRSGKYFFGDLREWLWEIIMDYTYTVRHLEEIVQDIPYADMYVGYSAGSIMISPINAPKVYVASPLTLMRTVQPLYTETALNLMHPRDPVAAPMPDAENVILKDRSIKRFLNPLAAHMSCMDTKDVLKHTIRWYDTHLGDNNG